eukprot:751156-Hanusia_phi.AAC.4
MEAEALKQYKQRRFEELGIGEETEEFSVGHAGLCIHEDYFWLAASPDGIVKEGNTRGILEIKCPYSQRIYKEVPEYYMDQVQGLMAILGCEWTDFVVWTPSEMKVERIRFKKDYWENFLFPTLKGNFARKIP